MYSPEQLVFQIGTDQWRNEVTKASGGKLVVESFLNDFEAHDRYVMLQQENAAFSLYGEEPSAISIPIDEWGHTSGAGPCSVAIVHSENNPGEYIFGHLVSGLGFEVDSSPVWKSIGDMPDNLTLTLMGGNLPPAWAQIERPEQIRRITQQMDNIGKRLNPRIAYWNNTPDSYINVVARVTKEGVVEGHIIHVYA